jgi:pyruvate dehydrogenase E2 component (dihydrolipoamide acetyltransferase)
MGAIREVLVPDIGDFSDIAVIEVMVKPGDRVKPEDSLIVLESDKATLDVPAPFGGAVTKLKVQVGDRVSEGTAILELEAEEATAQPPPSADGHADVPDMASGPEPAPAGSLAPSAVPPTLPHASPAVRRFARELGVELAQVGGTGPAQRILKDDVQAFVRAALTRATPAEARAGAAVSSQATHFDDADVTELEAFCAEAATSAGTGVDVAVTAAVLKAVVTALKKFPGVSAACDGEKPIPSAGCAIGLTMDAPDLRIAHLVHGVDDKGIVDIARELEGVTARMRDGAAAAAHADATFSVISAAGGTGFTPMLKPPAVAVLGVARAQPRLVERDGKVSTRRMLPLCLSYDSTLINEGSAARFIAFLATLLADLRRVSL